MTEQELNQAIANATGESVATIRAMGFVPLKAPNRLRRPRKANWDVIQLSRQFTICPQRRRATHFFG